MKSHREAGDHLATELGVPFQLVDDGITHFFANLKEPLVAIKNGLQGKGL